ncbi:MAG: aminopeptidase P family protein [Rhodobacteraceae bacterium]|nr:MAG: aminopeptidase P family protein [Paracoccaceae bacterium]
MGAAGLDALLLTTEPEVRYFSGFLTRFWQSPTRPWFLVVPASGDPIAVIPSIGAALMAKTWITDIRTWESPAPEDDGVSLLAECLREQGPRIGVPSGPESHLRMPLEDFERLKAAVAPGRIGPDAGIVRDLRMVKSPLEIARIEAACAIAGRAFARIDELAGPGVALAEVFRRFQRVALEEGADWVPYLAGGAGPLGYDDVISPATDAPLQPGDVLMLDTGLVRDGYFCDFDRNFAIGPVDARVHRAWDRLRAATEAGEVQLRPGQRACDVWHALQAGLGGGTGAGRLGHGVGMDLTEGLSFTATDRTVLAPGMVLTLEPGLRIEGGGALVHEDVYALTETGARRMSPPMPERIAEIGA